MSYRGGGRGSGRGGRGRGEYYKNKYGNKRGRSDGHGGRGRGVEDGNYGGTDTLKSNRVFDYNDISAQLYRIDGKSYPAYHDLEGTWKDNVLGFDLTINRTQSDPFAAPTRCRVVVKAGTARLPSSSYSNKVRAIAAADYIHRAFHNVCNNELRANQSIQGGKGWSGPKGGDIQIMAPNQFVIEQSAVQVMSSGNVVAQFTVNLPARGRTILAEKAIEIFTQSIPFMIKKSLLFSSFNETNFKHHVLNIEDQQWLRTQLDSNNLVAFVSDGSLLPRRSGVDDRPYDGPNATLFYSPASMKVEFKLPNDNKVITGMGIKKGVTLIVGGGFNGKSTLLDALQFGVYNKIPGDGREYVVSIMESTKIRAEDGRNVCDVNITPFIDNLPFGKDTSRFSSLDASGSTSQAANIMEAIEMGSKCLLLDEDTCATNFMIRDEKMIELVSPNKEPITPFIRKVRPMFSNHGVSTILVVGGTGDYFSVADTVIMMDSYECVDVTAKARAIAQKGSRIESDDHFGFISVRCPDGKLFVPNHKVTARSENVISYGDIDIDLIALEQIAAKPQTTAISCALQKISILAKDGRKSILELCEELDLLIDKNGLDYLSPDNLHGGFSRPRRFEIAGAINRFRKHKCIVQK